MKGKAIISSLIIISVIVLGLIYIEIEKDGRWSGPELVEINIDLAELNKTFLVLGLQEGNLQVKGEDSLNVFVYNNFSQEKNFEIELKKLRNDSVNINFSSETKTIKSKEQEKLLLNVSSSERGRGLYSLNILADGEEYASKSIVIETKVYS